MADFSSFRYPTELESLPKPYFQVSTEHWTMHLGRQVPRLTSGHLHLRQKRYKHSQNHEFGSCTYVRSLRPAYFIIPSTKRQENMANFSPQWPEGQQDLIIILPVGHWFSQSYDRFVRIPVPQEIAAPFPPPELIRPSELELRRLVEDLVRVEVHQEDGEKREREREGNEGDTVSIDGYHHPSTYADSCLNILMYQGNHRAWDAYRNVP